MQPGDIIYEYGEYKIKLHEVNFGKGVICNGAEIGAVKGFHFRLLKNDVPIKFYSTAWPHPSVEQPDFEKMKQEIISVFKKFM